MPRGFIRWETPQRSGAAGLGLADSGETVRILHLVAPAVTPRAVVDQLATLPVAAQPMEARDEAVFLLHTAAEIEHALLVQYLYAAFSFGDPTRRSDSAGGDLNANQHAMVFGPDGFAGWNRTLLDIAIEEMCHLMTVQNVLRVLGGPLNLEREDFPFRAQFYPFPFELEAATKDSLAKFVAAEMPEAPNRAQYPRIDEILERARLVVDSVPINRVGRLYARILELVGRLPEPLFRPETADTYQAPADRWRGKDQTTLPPSKRLKIVARFGGAPFEARAKVLDVLKIVAEQGEGPGQDPTGSHFDLFYNLYREFPETNPCYGPVTWHPALAVPSQPNTSPDPLPDPEAEAGRVTNGLALKWAHVINTRYRMLLAFILHSMSIDRTADGRANWFTKTVGWAFLEMGHLRPISDVLTRLPRRAANRVQDGRSEVAGVPFELPYTLNLPDRDVERWRLHRDLVASSERQLDAIGSDPATPGDPAAQGVVDTLRQTDAGILRDIDVFDPMGADKPPAPTLGGPMSRFQRVIQILDEAIGGPASDIGAHGAFWQGHTRDQFVAHKVFGRDLVIVGNGGDSNLVKALKGEAPFGSDLPTPPAGNTLRRMPAGLPPVPDDLIAFIKQWIDDGCPEDLFTPVGSGGTPAPTAAATEADMVTLIEFLKAPPHNAANRHSGVDIGGGHTLAELFADPQALLTHLKTQTVVQDNTEPAGTPLVVAGKPAESAFFRIIQRTGHPMKQRFALNVPAVGKTGVQIVETWISSLT